MLDRIMHSGKLVVGIKHDTAYYNTPTGAAGLELELLRRFAASLQLSLQLKTYPSDEQIIKALLCGEVYMAAGILIISEQQRQLVQFSTPYLETEQILLYRMGSPAPNELADLQTGSIEIPPDSRQELLLHQIRQYYVPELTWTTTEADKSQLILPRLNNGDIEFTITSRHEFERNRAYYPNVLPGMTLSAKEHIAWGFSRTMDNGLLQAADHFLTQQTQAQELQELSKKYFQTLEPRSFVEQRDFWTHVKHRLPKYTQWFRQAAAETDVDWLMLAAIGYQESHWDPRAVSPTGVKGIMMLTKAAAKQLKLTDRADPKQSILGGARYLIWKAAKIPERIQGKDRLWLTLAAYNVGFGHLEDARILTQRQGGDPDLWEDVKQRLPLLSKKKYYETLKHGKARGQEPVTYVENIRYYHHLLSWYYYQSPERPGSS